MCMCLWMIVGVYFTSIESSVLSSGGLRLMMLAVPSNASLSSFRKTPQNGTTYGVGAGKRKTHPVIALTVVRYGNSMNYYSQEAIRWLKEVIYNKLDYSRCHLNKQQPTLHPGILRALVTTFLYSEEDSCWAMASFRLLIVSMSDWSINCHIFSTLRDLDDKENLKCQLVKPDILCQCVQVIFNKKKMYICLWAHLS